MTTPDMEAEYFVKTYELGGFDEVQPVGSDGPIRVKRIEARGIFVCVAPVHGETQEMLPAAIARPVKSIPPLVL